MKIKYLLLLGLSFLLITACEDGGVDFDQIDVDDSDNISHEEYMKDWYQQGYFNIWDRNRDGKISKEEWESGLKEYYEGYAFTESDYEEWDTNGDMFLDEEELAQGQFTIYDTDMDGDIERVEYEAYHTEAQ